MERKIGERFDYNGVTLEVCPELGFYSCKGCFFNRRKKCNMIGSCVASKRRDQKLVIFKEVKP